MATSQAALVDRELERGQRRILADGRCDHLVSGDAEPGLGARLCHCAAQENRRGAVVMRRRAARPVGHRMGEVADDVELRLQGLEWGENLGQREVAARACGCPARHRRAVRKIDESGPDRARRALRDGPARRQHRVEQRQGNCGAGAREQGASREMLSCEKSHYSTSAVTRIRKASLATMPCTSEANR